MSTRVPRGLYLITRGHGSAMLDAVSAALDGGVVMVQHRDLEGDDARRHRDAALLAELCAARSVPLIIDHDIDLAHGVGAAGVHLGEVDGDPRRARERLGDHALLGVSCYASAERARAAAAAGADYVSFGAFFASPTKPGAGHAPLSVLHDSAGLDVARVAIGGITPDNGGQLIEAGADLLAVVSSLFDADDIRAAAARFADLFASSEASPA